MKTALICSICLLLLGGVCHPGAVVAGNAGLSANAAYPGYQSTAYPSGRPVGARQPAADDVHSVSAKLDSVFPETELGVTGHTLHDVEQLEKECFDEVNLQRNGAQLKPLELSAGLLIVARNYSRRMADEGFFAHQDPAGKTVRQRVSDAGIAWRALGENLAFNKGYVNPVACSVKGWLDSPGHRENIMNPRYNCAAIGVWISQDDTVYFTQIFMAK